MTMHRLLCQSRLVSCASSVSDTDRRSSLWPLVHIMEVRRGAMRAVPGVIVMIRSGASAWCLCMHPASQCGYVLHVFQFSILSSFMTCSLPSPMLQYHFRTHCSFTLSILSIIFFLQSYLSHSSFMLISMSFYSTQLFSALRQFPRVLTYPCSEMAGTLALVPFWFSLMCFMSAPTENSEQMCRMYYTGYANLGSWLNIC